MFLIERFIECRKPRHIKQFVELKMKLSKAYLATKSRDLTVNVAILVMVSNFYDHAISVFAIVPLD